MLLAFVYRVVCALLRLVLTRGGPVSAAEIELLVLRHERRVLRRRAGGAAWRPGDRLWLTALSRCLPGRAWHVFPCTRARCGGGIGSSCAGTGPPPASAAKRDGRRSPLRCGN